MATVVKYNGITMHNVVTRRWDQEMVYDDTGTDLIGERLSLAFEGVIHAQRTPLENSVAFTAPGGSVASAVSVYHSVENALKIPRRTIVITFDGETVVDVAGGGFDGSPEGGIQKGHDIDNGPKPRRVSLESIVANQVFRIRFEIDVMVGDCKRIRPNNLVVSNRWSVDETMDRNFFTTRVIQGKMRLAMGRESNTGFPTGHQYKGLVVPGLEDGFRRERVQFTAEADGLTCNYRIVDQQTHTAAPWPATRIDVQQEESTSDGVKFETGVSIVLEGAPSSDKRLLIERAVQIADQRIAGLNLGNPDGVSALITHANIRDHIGERNMIEMQLRVMHITERPYVRLFRLRAEELGLPLELPPAQDFGDEIPGTSYDPKISPLPKLHGYDPHGEERRPAVLFMLGVFLQEPCMTTGQRRITAGVTSRREVSDDRDRPDTEVQEGDTGALPLDNDQTDRYSFATKAAIYTVSQVETSYEGFDSKVSMPIARPGAGGFVSALAGTNVVFDLAQPQTVRRIRVNAERAGGVPQIPEPFKRILRGNGLVETLIDHNKFVHPPVLSVDGRHQIIRVEATYTYSLNRPPLDSEPLAIGRHPYTQGLVQQITGNQMHESQLA